MRCIVTYTQHCGNNPDQQDALWQGDRVFQQRDLPTGQHECAGDEIFAAVADGVANSPSPQKASRCVLEALAAGIRSGGAFDGRLLRRVHGRLCDALARGRTFGASTTLATVACRNDRCTVLSVGDSRVYRIAADGQWQQLSRDHTILNRMIDEGEAEEGKDYASFYGMLDSCLVADDEETEFSICRAEAQLLPGDAILICTDGVHDTLGDEKLRKTTTWPIEPLQQVERWRKAILKAGAPDNFSIVLLSRQ